MTSEAAARRRSGGLQGSRLVCIGLAAALAVPAGAGAMGQESAPRPVPRGGGATKPRRVFEVPYRLMQTQHLVVRARLNGRGPLYFIIDTGAPALFMASSAARQVGLEDGKEGWTIVRRLEIEGGPLLEGISGRIEDLFQLKGMNSLGLAGGRIDGVLGYNVLAHFRMEIDLNRPTMTWTELEYAPPPPPSISELLPEGEELEEPETLGAMEGFANLASALLKRKPPEPPVERGFFGINLAGPVTGARPGARIAGIVPGGPAGGSHLRAGDRITRVTLPGGKPQAVRSNGDLVRLTGTVVAGQAVRLVVVRGRSALTVTVTAGRGAL